MNKPTLEAVKALAKSIYQKHALGTAHQSHSKHLSRWLVERYDEFEAALCEKWEMPKTQVTETDTGDTKLDVVVQFFDMPKFIFEIDLIWSL